MQNSPMINQGFIFKDYLNTVTQCCCPGVKVRCFVKKTVVETVSIRQANERMMYLFPFSKN